MIHRFWQGVLPSTEPFVGNVVRQIHQDVMVCDWREEMYTATMRQTIERSEGKVREEDRLRHRANVVRLVALYEFGGWWADHDLIPLRHFSSLPSPATAAHGSRCNCWMAFSAGHPSLALAIAAIEEAPMSSTAKSVSVSGERLLERLWGDEVARVSLPFDSQGRPLSGAEPWAVHLYSTASTRRV